MKSFDPAQDYSPSPHSSTGSRPWLSATASKFIITGGKTLAGEVFIQGSKNTILPLIAASLLTEDPVILERVPDIRDVAVMLEIAEKLGAAVEWDKEKKQIAIRAKTLTSAAPDRALSRRLRGSILFAGALLGRFRKVTLPYPGGDAIGARPLQTHFHALECLGAVIEDGDTISIDGWKMTGRDITLEEPSVTATESTILASVLIPGKTVLRLPAFEPHVQELVSLLSDMGADIRWRDILHLEINGVKNLTGARRVINPDELEISSFATLAAATGSEITLRGIEPRYLEAVFLQLKTMGVSFAADGETMTIRKANHPYKGFRVQSGLYPKLGSDHLPPFAVLATQAEGESLIHDWLYEGRLGYIGELAKMGANCRLLDPHRAIIIGPTKLSACEMAGMDIRSGMTLIIAALTAEGRSTISNIEHIDRGYENIEGRLQALGAEIQRIID